MMKSSLKFLMIFLFFTISKGKYPEKKAKKFSKKILNSK